MKFEQVEPSGKDSTAARGYGQGFLSLPAKNLQDGFPPLLKDDQEGALVSPVRRRMSRALDGVRTSLDRLRAHAAEQAMAQARAQARRAATTAAEVDPGAVFHAHRFSASPKRGER